MTETELESAVKTHANTPEPVGPTNSTTDPLRLGTTLVLGEPVVEKPLDDPKAELASAQQVAEESQAQAPTEAAPVESGNGAQEVDVKPETEKETKEGAELAAPTPVEPEPPKVEQPVEQPHVPEPSLSEVEVKESDVKNVQVEQPPPELPEIKTRVPAVTRQDQDAFKQVVKATRSKKHGKTADGDKDHDSPGEEPAPRKRKEMKRPSAAPKRKGAKAAKVTPSKDKEEREEVDSPLKPRNLEVELEEQKDEEEQQPKPKAKTEKPKKRPASAEASPAQPPKAAARKSKAQPKTVDPPDAKDTSKDMPPEVQAVMGSKTTFAGRRCPKTKDAASRFAAMVTTYKKKIEPLVDSTSFLQVGVYQIRGVVLVLSSKLLETTKF